MTLLKKHI